ncbi:fungal-specific transcription factor domain-containing protein [Talaromyces proteolyticus]|uniref:Fungal-specific transcription factor domain-containing protein n=1 Tax=Talaromyces proteolyticus TaxID=1131652 RepID=A0AAD4KDK4_9EURO|nr:fungal-specific transcription factor domain-containing protein [Talaromyces proteolyticus]KAH8689185.1 fungal-specific transcription factor domain-containing protein [Talaromyces proteolyticus]
MPSTISRSRSGCRTCRSRKIKCDEQRPVCRHCLKSNVECVYGLRLVWHEESLSKGMCHGRLGVWSKKGPLGRSNQQQRLQKLELRSECRVFDRANVRSTEEKDKRSVTFLNTTEHDVRVYLEYEGFVESPVAHTPSSSLRNAPHALDYDSALLSYYEAVVCSSCTLLDDASHNPYRHLILPMALQSEGLYHATLAVSAQILGLAEPKYRFAALNHGHQALKCLIVTLKRGKWSNAEIDEILGLALMLCWFEITDGCRPSWVMHLNGIHALIIRYPQLFKRSTSGLYRFFNRYFSFHVVLARTAFRVEDDLSLPNAIDSYMGFSNSLLLLINEIADLAWKYPSKVEIDSDIISIRKKVQLLRNSLSNLQQTPPPLCTNINFEEYPKNIENPTDLYTRTVSEFEAIAEANRIGAVLLLHEVCSSRLQRPDVFGSDGADTKSDSVRRILEIMLENINRMNRTAALPLWPLFLAGCCATSEEDRIIVLRIFEETEKPKRFGNITPAREVVEMIWRQRDLSVQDDRKRRLSAAARRFGTVNSTKSSYNRPGASSTCQSQYSQSTARRCGGMFEWERAMSMMGGLKLSLT